MRRLVTLVGVVAAAVCIFGAVKASSHNATRPGACAATCDVGGHRLAMNDSMPMRQMGSDSSGMPMGPHMKLTTLQPLQTGDRARANAIVAALRVTLSRYGDYRVALGDGYKIFMGGVKQPRYHFTNWVNALAAERSFDPARPTSLLYEKSGEGYRLVGAMYTAPKSSTLDQLDGRVPLSIARWHEHVDICWGPRGTDTSKYVGPGAEFGLLGSIATQGACDAAGGRFQPVLFNWMVHVYPFETNPAKVWRVD